LPLTRGGGASGGPQDIRRDASRRASTSHLQEARADRIASGDPRPSIEERYLSLAVYQTESCVPSMIWSRIV